MVSQQQEREDKYDVDSGFDLPDLGDLLPADGTIESAVFELENSYFDTPTFDLRRLRMTLRRRVGGPDAGWHLKIPSGGERTEVRSRSRAKALPKALSEVLAGIRRGQDLIPVATLRTTRSVTRLLDASGEMLVEVADDRVISTPGDAPVHGPVGAEAASVPAQAWREVEVELGPAGDEKLLEAIGHRLRTAGARGSAYSSKLQRALGTDPLRASEPDPTTLGGLVARYLSEQCVAIVEGDLGLRLQHPVVHPTRVAVRRLRSTLRIFRPVFDAEQAAALDGELVWFAGLLGEVRDRDILRHRLATLVAELPPEYVLGPVAADIEATLLAETSGYLKKVDTAMRGERYQALTETIEAWRTGPPFTDEAAGPASTVTDYMDRAQKKLDKRLRTAGGDVEALHRARKAGKRFRYAAELSLPVLGHRASKKVKVGKKLQELLGDHQDSVVTVAFLRRMGAAAGSNQSQNGFTYGLLMANELHRAEQIRRKLSKRYG